MNNSSNVITVEVREGSCDQIRGIMPISNYFLPPDEGYTHPFGNLYIMLQCPDLSGGSAVVRIYYHGSLNTYALKYRKFGQTEPGALPVWYTYDNVVFGQTTIDGHRVVYADIILTDNDLGDFFLHEGDGDGFIIDPGGPARPAGIAIPTLSEWGMIIFSVLLALSGILYLTKRRATTF